MKKKNNFFCRHFRVILREDPNSIFSPNVQIENTLGPIHYDTTRVYTGTLEGIENFIKKNITLDRMLTICNLFLFFSSFLNPQITMIPSFMAF